ncbi:MAG: hypothetical protein WA741_17680 [Candidatus Sulfotelmatobacter sp.]
MNWHIANPSVSLSPTLVLMAVLLSRQSIQSPQPPSQPVSAFQSQELKFYGNAQSYLDESIPGLKKTVRDLDGLRAAASQEPLRDLLPRAAASLSELLVNLPDLISSEAVTQSEWAESQAPICIGMSGCVDPSPISQKSQQFSYIILAHLNGDHRVLLEEYRTTRDGKPITAGDEPRFQGFASFWVIFSSSNLSESHFRYLGEQKENGRSTFVVAFAQIPGSVEHPPAIVTRNGSIPMLLQGIAWLDQTDLHLVRLRTDLLSPQPEIGYKEQTSDIQFGRARIHAVDLNVWVPETVHVKTATEGQIWEEQHHYSKFRLYKAKTKIVFQPN